MDKLNEQQAKAKRILLLAKPKLTRGFKLKPSSLNSDWKFSPGNREQESEREHERIKETEERAKEKERERERAN